MTTLRTALSALAVIIVVAGCASTDNELSQKEKDRIAREQQRSNQKQAQAQEKMLRDATQGGSRKGTR
jgi:hypothetical protein